MIGIFLFSFLRGMNFSRTVLRGSSVLHDEAVRSVLSAKMRFFDVTPMGRILARFSSDVDRVDATLSDSAESAVTLLVRCFISVIVVIVVFPFFLIPVVALWIVYGFLLVRFRPTLRQFKRLDMISKSPLLSWVESVASGVTSFRAWGMARDYDYCVRRFRAVMDDTLVAHFSYQACARWIAVRLENFTVALTVICVLFVPLFASKISPGVAGLA